MSHLKILVCSSLLVVTTLMATSVNADHRWSGGQNSGCGRSNGNSMLSGGYQQGSPSYGYGGYQGYGGPQSYQNYGFGNQGLHGFSGFGNQFSQNRGYDRAPVPRFGSSFNGNFGQPSRVGYDSDYGDYYRGPSGASQLQFGSYQGGRQYPNDGRGFNGNSRW